MAAFWDQLGGPRRPGLIRGPARTSSSASSTPASGPSPELLRPRKAEPTSAGAKLATSRSPAGTASASPPRRQRRSLWDANLCNQKLIAAQYFNAALGRQRWHRRRAAVGVHLRRVTTTVTARTPASTAGGNYGVPPTGPAAAFGAVSGMAPRARIAAYKALWSTEDGRRRAASTPDLVAAIDTGRRRRRRRHQLLDLRHADELPRPRRDRVPVRSRRGHLRRRLGRQQRPDHRDGRAPGPWITTVAAGTHNRNGTDR